MPTITFQVELDTPLRNSHADVNALRSEGDILDEQRSTWFPNHILNNRQLKQGDQFTVSGSEAVYLEDNYTTGDFAILSVISSGLVFTEQGELE